MLMNKYHYSMGRTVKFVEECKKGSFEYFKYLDFYKSVDKELFEFLNTHLSTTHK